MRLSEVKAGRSLRIISIPDDEIRVRAIRLGMFEGADAECIFKINKGPVMLNVGGQEIAVGNPLAEKIIVNLRK